MTTHVDPPHPGLETILSTARFGTYLAWADGDRDRAVALYALNAALSESFYTSLHMLEVAFRNRIDTVLRDAAGENWFDLPDYQLNARQLEMLGKAREQLADGHKDESHDSLVAALTFGFWTALVGREYETLWQKTLHAIAKRTDGKGLRRKDFSGPLAPIRLLRNRVAHHEPIIHWSLPRHQDAILELTGWLSPAAAEWSRAHSRFQDLYPTEGIKLAKQRDEPAQP
ncbi:Abi family protein [Aureimonas sp. N4]|uniref:Abi family protein n=1 Tax=Aureimonas sp. N4 TaxID=1638165 RepID=UPI00078251B1|nr:Abi family protein [Aureimonas sp. N4]